MDTRELVRDVFDVTEELGPDDDHCSTGVVDDLQHLGGRQPPVHGDDDGPELGQSECDFEEFDAVLLDERDPVPEPDACGPEGVGGLTRPGVQLAVSDDALTHDEGGDISPLGAVHPHDVGDGWRCLRLAWPISTCPGLIAGRFGHVSRFGGRRPPSRVRAACA